MRGTYPRARAASPSMLEGGAQCNGSAVAPLRFRRSAELPLMVFFLFLRRGKSTPRADDRAASGPSPRHDRPVRAANELAGNCAVLIGPSFGPVPHAFWCCFVAHVASLTKRAAGMLTHPPHRREVDHIRVRTGETPAVPWYCEPRQWKVQRLNKPTRSPFARETPGLSMVGRLPSGSEESRCSLSPRLAKFSPCVHEPTPLREHVADHGHYTGRSAAGESRHSAMEGEYRF